MGGERRVCFGQNTLGTFVSRWSSPILKHPFPYDKVCTSPVLSLTGSRLPSGRAFSAHFPHVDVYNHQPRREECLLHVSYKSLRLCDISYELKICQGMY